MSDFKTKNKIYCKTKFFSNNLTVKIYFAKMRDRFNGWRAVMDLISMLNEMWRVLLTLPRAR